jgi:hypothetical protein
LTKRNDAHSTNDSDETSRKKSERTSKSEESDRKKSESINKKYDEIDEISKKKSTKIILRFFSLASIDDKIELEKKRTTRRISRFFFSSSLIDEVEMIVIMLVEVISQDDMNFSTITFAQSSFVSEFSIRVFRSE